MNCTDLGVDPVVLFLGGVLLLVIGGCLGAIAVACLRINERTGR